MCWRYNLPLDIIQLGLRRIVGHLRGEVYIVDNMLESGF